MNLTGTRSASLVLVLLLCGTVPGSSQAPEGADGGHPALSDLDYFVGSWSLTLFDRQPDGHVIENRGRSDVYYILDGHAIQDDFRAMDPAGRVVFRGTSIRTRGTGPHQWHIKWVMVGDPGYTIIEATYDEKADELRATGHGIDRAGEFLERFVYRFRRPDRYVFEMDRSYDGGKTWSEGFGRIEAVRIPAP